MVVVLFHKWNNFLCQENETTDNWLFWTDVDGFMLKQMMIYFIAMPVFVL